MNLVVPQIILAQADFNSSDAGDGIFQLWGPISCLLMPWLLKSPWHQQAWYWLYMTGNMCWCPKVNFIYLDQAKSMIRFKMWIQVYLLWSLKQFSMLRVKISYSTDLSIGDDHNSITKVQWNLRKHGLSQHDTCITSSIMKMPSALLDQTIDLQTTLHGWAMQCFLWVFWEKFMVW